jgi:hypothetical protein
LLGEEYRNRYEELERQMMKVLDWRLRWFVKLDVKIDEMQHYSKSGE